MKKISSMFVSNHEYILRPFALVNHEHVEYVLQDSATQVTITSPVDFQGLVTGIPGLTSPIGITDGWVLTVDNETAVWAAPTGGGGVEINDLTVSVTWADIPIANIPTGTTSSTVALGNHTHTGVYEPADATILKDADIGVTVATIAQGNLADTALQAETSHADVLVDGDVGVSVQAYDATIVVDADIGVTIATIAQGNLADTALQSETSHADVLVDADIGSTVAAEAHTHVGEVAVTAFADNAFEVFNVTDETKKIVFDAAAITTATTRTITMPDADVDLGVLINRDFIHVQPTTVQNIGGANGTAVVINWDTTPLHIDTASFTHSSSVNPSRILVVSTGRYSINVSVSGETLGAARSTLMSSVLVDGTTAITRGRQRNYTRGLAYGDLSWNHNTEIELTAGQYIEIVSTVQDTDGVYTINSIVAECELIMRRIG